MEVFVISLKNYGWGEDEVSVFSTREKALAFIERMGEEYSPSTMCSPDTDVWEIYVGELGEQTEEELMENGDVAMRFELYRMVIDSEA